MEIKSTSNMSFGVTLQLSEQEARALEAIAMYGVEEFLKVFYAHLGKSYLQPYEDATKDLFKTIKTELPKHLGKFTMLRKKWAKNLL